MSAWNNLCMFKFKKVVILKIFVPVVYVKKCVCVCMYVLYIYIEIHAYIYIYVCV